MTTHFCPKHHTTQLLKIHSSYYRYLVTKTILNNINFTSYSAHQKFKALAPEKVGHNKNAKLPMAKILQYPELRVNPFRDRICKVFSSSNDGDCTFEDFLDMMSVFSEMAPKAVKAEHAFRIFGKSFNIFIKINLCLISWIFYWFDFLIKHYVMMIEDHSRYISSLFWQLSPPMSEKVHNINAFF